MTSAFKLKTSFSNSIKTISHWDGEYSIVGKADELIYSELLNTKRHVNNTDDLTQVTAKIGGVNSSVCIMNCFVKLSEHQEKMICKAIETFPNNRLKLEFEGHWEILKHLRKTTNFTVDVIARLNSQAIDIKVIS